MQASRQITDDAEQDEAADEHDERAIEGGGCFGHRCLGRFSIRIGSRPSVEPRIRSACLEQRGQRNGMNATPRTGSQRRQPHAAGPGEAEEQGRGKRERWRQPAPPTRVAPLETEHSAAAPSSPRPTKAVCQS
jgi:hypothetical protein